MEDGGHLGKVGLLGFFFNHGGQRQGLIHGHAQFRGPLLPLVGENIVRLIQQLFHDVLGRGVQVDLIGIGGQIAFQQILAAVHVPGLQLFLKEVIVGHALAGLAQVQELCRILQNPLFLQVVGDVLDGVARDDRNIRHGGPSVAGGQKLGDLEQIHALFHLVIARLNLLAHSGEVAVILEHGAVLDQSRAFQIAGYPAQAIARLHGEGDLRIVCGVHRAQILVLHMAPHGGQHAEHDQQRAQADQDGSENFPQAAEPVQAVFSVLPQGFVVVILFFRDLRILSAFQ